MGDAVELHEHDARNVGASRPLRPPPGQRGRAGSNHASSSIASTDETIVLMTASPITITSAVPKPSIVMPGSWSSTSNTSRASSTIAPMPERQHRDRHEDERQERPHDRVDDADDEAGEQGVGGAVDVEAASTAASTHRASAVVAMTTTIAADDLPAVGRSSGARTNVSVAVMACCSGRSGGRGAGSDQLGSRASTRSRSAAPAVVNSLGEAVHGRVEPRGRGARRRGVRAPVHRHDESRAHQPRRRAARSGSR